MTTQSDRCVTLDSGNTACLRMTLRWWLADSFLKNTSLVNSLSTPCVSERWSAWALLNSCLHGVSASLLWRCEATLCFIVVVFLKCPSPRLLLTAGTELRFICCGWFMGDAARAPIGAWDIWALGRAMWLNWFSPARGGGGGRWEDDDMKRLVPKNNFHLDLEFRRHDSAESQNVHARERNKKNIFSPFSFF